MKNRRPVSRKIDRLWWEKRQHVLRSAPFDKQWSIKEKGSVLDYLHGDVADYEVKACCYYEYARASETLRKARRAYNPADPENSSLTVSNYPPGWTCGWFRFWRCLGYPVSPWRELSPEQQKEIVTDFLKSPHAPPIRDVLVLKGTGVLDTLAQQTERVQSTSTQSSRLRFRARGPPGDSQ